MKKINQKDLQGPSTLTNSLIFCNHGPQLLSSVDEGSEYVGVGRVPSSFHELYKEAVSVWWAPAD